MQNLKKRLLLSKEQQAEYFKDYLIIVELLEKEGRSFSRTNINWYKEKYPEYNKEIDKALKARQELILNMEGFIIVTAQKYARIEIPAEDLIQVGREAAMYALSKFDQSKNTKFSSYSAMWIRSKIAEAVKKSALIPVPSYSGQKQFSFVSESGFTPEDSTSIYDRIVDQSGHGILDDVLEIISDKDREILEKSYQSSGELDLWGIQNESLAIIEKLKEALD